MNIGFGLTFFILGGFRLWFALFDSGSSGICFGIRNVIGCIRTLRRGTRGGVRAIHYGSNRYNRRFLLANRRLDDGRSLHNTNERLGNASRNLFTSSIVVIEHGICFLFALFGSRNIGIGIGIRIR